MPHALTEINSSAPSLPPFNSLDTRLLVEKIERYWVSKSASFNKDVEHNSTNLVKNVSYFYRRGNEQLVGRWQDVLKNEREYIVELTINK